MWKKINLKNTFVYLRAQDPGFLTGLALGLLIGAIGVFALMI